MVLFGGSSVLTSYLPDEHKHHTVLVRELAKAYPEQAIEVFNHADNGEFLARYLLRGTYERHRTAMTGIDVAIIRFGINDQKRVDAPEFRRQLERFATLLKEDFPGVRVLIETGAYVDYPAHYSFDRNRFLNPFWAVARLVSEEIGYPLIDLYAATLAEAKAGNWDIRVRKKETGKDFVIDASQDPGQENNPDWFTDIHPNPEGVRLAVREEVKALLTVFPRRLPAGQVARVRASRPDAFYEGYLEFPAERLLVLKNTAIKDQLQQPTN